MKKCKNPNSNLRHKKRLFCSNFLKPSSTLNNFISSDSSRHISESNDWKFDLSIKGLQVKSVWNFQVAGGLLHSPQTQWSITHNCIASVFGFKHFCALSFDSSDQKTLSAGFKTLPYKLQPWSKFAQRNFPKLEWNRFYDPTHIYKGTVRFALFSLLQDSFFKFFSVIYMHKHLKPIIA